VIVPRKATQSATIVVEKVTSPANARLLLNQNPATDAVKKVMSHVNVPTKNLARVVVAAAAAGAVALGAVATLAVVVTLLVVVVEVAVVKNVISVVRSVTSRETAPSLEEPVTAAEVGMAADTVAEAVVVVVAAVVRPATPAAASVTCHATAPRARSATIVSLRQSSWFQTNNV
jgi:hypothetical protein